METLVAAYVVAGIAILAYAAGMLIQHGRLMRRLDQLCRRNERRTNPAPGRRRAA